MLSSVKNRLHGNRLARGVAWNIASLAFLAGGGVLMNLIVIRFRGEAALGIFNQVYAVYIVLSQIGVGGLQHSVLKHVSYQQSDRDLCGDITSAALLLVTAISVPLCAGVYVLAEPVGTIVNSPAVAEGIRLVSPGLLFFALNKVLINVLNGLQWMRAYAIFRSVRFVLIPLFIVIIAWLDLPDSYIALSLTLTEAVLFIALAIFVYRWVVPLKPITQLRARLTEHVSFGVRGILSGMLMELNTRVDVLMLGIFVTDAQVGVFSFAAILAEGIAQVPMAVRWNVDPVIGGYFASGATEQIAALSRRIRRVFVPAMLLLGIVAVVAYPLIYNVLAGGTDLAPSWSVFAIITTGVIIGAGYRPFAGLLLQAGRPGLFTGFIFILFLTNVVLNLLLIPSLGINGAAFATMLTFVGEAVLLYLLARRLFHIHL